MLTAPTIDRMQIDRFETDVLILGAGGAGLFAALHAQQTAPRGARITIAVKGLLGKCGCTRMVQGGYNVALGPGDSVERHFMDTIIGGKWLPNQDMAWRLCEQAVVRVQELENEIGCFFDRTADGALHHKAFAGQTADRTVHKGDLTGIEIVNRLMEQVLARPIDKLEEHRAVGLIPAAGGGAIAGVLMIDMRAGRLKFVRAKTVLMATGGGPTMYKYNTPSGDKSMDGLAMALRAGLPLRDMEMVQFHPTGLLAGPHSKMTGTVLEEGLRGAGGRLVDHQGRRFMYDYDAKGERATRDIVSRGIYAEMRKRNDPGHVGVFLSMSHLGPETVRAKFKGMVKRCADCGFDLAGGLVEVAPTAHYLMGGVVVDVDTRTEMEGLYVAGEDAGGAHGSNRLGGNGVANSTVFGGVAGETMAADLGKFSGFRDPDEAVLAAEIDRVFAPIGKTAGLIHPLRDALQEAMWEDVGVMRTAQGLRRGAARIEEIRTQLAEVGVDGAALGFNLTWHDWLNLASLLEVSDVIGQAALARENSRGAHFREDFPEEGDLETSFYTLARRGPDGALNVERAPVDFTIVRPGETILPADAPETLVAAQ